MSSRVCVVGSFMADLVVHAPCRPKPGETVIGTSFERHLGGKGFNQAVAAARAGAATAMVGRVGDDDFGLAFVNQLRSEGIDAANVSLDPTVGTGIGMPLVEPSGENSIVVVPLANHRMSVSDIDAAADVIASSGVVLLQLELPVEVVVAAARHARLSGARVILNPAPALSADVLLQFAGAIDVLVPNETEAATLAGTPGRFDASMAAVLRERTGADVVVTLGDEGALVVDDDGPTRLAAHQVRVVDSVGAGDAFCGTLGAWLARGATLREAVAYANAAGALAVTRTGAEPSMPTAPEVDALLAAR